ncbi:hypothetical protein G9C84_15120 [Halolamina sp. R1-12]|nr:hypothetical protein [Halolamina sp. R1-12]
MRAYDLPDVDRREEPVVPESVPVEIAPEYFDASRNRVTTLLADLPTPLGPGDIPNGYVREQLVDAAADATDRLSEAQGAPTALVALTALRQARADARYAAAGWAVVEEDRSAETLEAEHRQVVSDAQSVRDDHEYVGDDPVRAALVHRRIEDLLERAIATDDPRREGNRLLAVAEWGETVESALACLGDARHLDEQFTASLPADAGTVEETLRGAAEALFADVQSRNSNVPPEPTGEEWGVQELVIDELRQRFIYGAGRVADANGPASAVVDANRQLTRVEALDRLRGRIDDGDLSRPQSAEAVREIRSNAYDALRTALADSAAPDLTRTAITNAGWRVAHADRDLSRYDGEFPVSRLDRTIAEYVVATAVGQAAPGVSEETAETLESA